MWEFGKRCIQNFFFENMKVRISMWKISTIELRIYKSLRVKSVWIILMKSGKLTLLRSIFSFNIIISLFDYCCQYQNINYQYFTDSTAVSLSALPLLNVCPPCTSFFKFQQERRQRRGKTRKIYFLVPFPRYLMVSLTYDLFIF